jgi:hypothetical protein
MGTIVVEVGCGWEGISIGSPSSFAPPELVESRPLDVQGFVFVINDNGSIEIQLSESNLSVCRKLDELPRARFPVVLLSKHVCSCS